ncbi:MAG TPA: nuclear transport factor 2 family protein [Rubricoccaceae bacterium]|jgi:uncharacterized protein (TIGR02246 family)
MSAPRPRRSASTVLLVLVLAGCAASSPTRLSSPPDAAVTAALAASAEAWNRGDLDGHVAMYADSAAFMTGTGPLIGRDRTADALRSAFFRDGRPVQQLRFESIVVRPLGADHALVTGHFILSGGGQDDHSGWFSTVWTRGAAGWRVIHDHSS